MKKAGLIAAFSLFAGGFVRAAANLTYPYNLTAIQNVNSLTGLLVATEGVAPVSEFIVIIVAVVSFGIVRLFSDTGDAVVGATFISMLVSTFLFMSGALGEGFLYATTLLFAAAVIVKLMGKQ